MNGSSTSEGKANVPTHDMGIFIPPNQQIIWVISEQMSCQSLFFLAIAFTIAIISNKFEFVANSQRCMIFQKLIIANKLILFDSFVALIVSSQQYQPEAPMPNPRVLKGTWLTDTFQPPSLAVGQRSSAQHRNHHSQIHQLMSLQLINSWLNHSIEHQLSV